jgi:hypothetical protein
VLTIIGQAAPRDLSTLDTVKGELGARAKGRTDESLARLIRSASSAIARHCGRQFQRETLRQQETFSRPGPIFLLRRPIVGEVAVSIGGQAQDAAGFTLDRDSGLLVHAGGRYGDGTSREHLYGCGWGEVAVTYTGGWVLPSFPAAAIAAAGPDDLLPAEIEEALLLTVSAWLSGRGRDPMLRSDTVEGVGGSSWVASSDMEALPPQAAALLEGRHAVRGG